jgi:hypothetical protein
MILHCCRILLFILSISIGDSSFKFQAVNFTRRKKWSIAEKAIRYVSHTTAETIGKDARDLLFIDTRIPFRSE